MKERPGREVTPPGAYGVFASFLVFFFFFSGLAAASGPSP